MAVMPAPGTGLQFPVALSYLGLGFVLLLYMDLYDLSQLLVFMICGLGIYGSRYV